MQSNQGPLPKLINGVKSRVMICSPKAQATLPWVFEKFILRLGPLPLRRKKAEWDDDRRVPRIAGYGKVGRGGIGSGRGVIFFSFALWSMALGSEKGIDDDDGVGMVLVWCEESFQTACFMFQVSCVFACVFFL